MLFQEIYDLKTKGFLIATSIKFLIKDDTLFCMSENFIYGKHKIEKSRFYNVVIRVDNNLKNPTSVFINNNKLMELSLGVGYLGNVGFFTEGKSELFVSNLTVKYDEYNVKPIYKDFEKVESLYFFKKTTSSYIPDFLFDLIQNNGPFGEGNAEKIFLKNSIKDPQIQFISEKPIISDNNLIKTYELSYRNQYFDISFNNVPLRGKIVGDELLIVNFHNKIIEDDYIFFLAILEKLGFSGSDSPLIFNRVINNLKQVGVMDPKNQLFLIIFDESILK